MATSALEIQEVNEDFLNLKNVTPINQESDAVSVDETQTYLRKLQSRSILTPVVKKCELLAAPAAPGFIGRMLQSVTHTRAQQDPLESSIDRLAADLNIREIGRSRMIEINYSSDSPEKAALVANAVAQELLEQNLETRGMLSQNVSDWINKQLDSSRENLVQSEQALDAYSKKAGLVYFGGASAITGPEMSGTSLSSERLRQVQEELSRAQADRMSKQTIFELAKTTSPDTAPFLASDGALRVQQDKLIDLKRQKAELGSNYTPRYGTMRSIEAQIQVLQDALQNEHTNIVQQTENEYRAALGREELLQKQYREQAKLVTEEGAKAVEYQMLRREVESNRQIYEDMLQRTKQARVAAALRANNIRIVDSARVPAAPYKPNVMMNAAAGSVGGFCLAAGWVIFFTGGGKIRRPGELKSIVGVSELGAIRSSRSLSTETRHYLALANSEADQKAIRSAQPTHLAQEQLAETAQAFSAILTSLRLSERNDQCRVVAVTSPSAMEGKTTILSGLAITLARMQQRVLVIDGDLYKPELHQRLDAPKEPGLAELLRAADDTARILSKYIHQTRVSNLSILPGGTGGPAPLLFSDRLKDVLHEVRRRYDFVLVDTPPLLQISDARVLSRLCDSAVLVVRSGQTTREAALLSLDRLQEDGAQVLGTILNDWAPNASELKAYTYLRHTGIGASQPYNPLNLTRFESDN
jgi:capsular exopolysaccharide synthesis family protein